MPVLKPEDIEGMDLPTLDELAANLDAEITDMRARLKLVNRRREQLNIEQERAALNPDRSLDQGFSG